MRSLLDAKVQFEAALTAVVDHEAQRPRQTTGLAWGHWYSQRTQLQVVCGQREAAWRALDEQAKQAYQVLTVHRGRLSGQQYAKRLSASTALAEEAEALLVALCGPATATRTLMDVVTAALQPPRGPDGRPLLPPLI